MTISDIIIDVRRFSQEPDADPNGFYSDESIKRYIKRCERRMAEVAQEAFETTRSFTITSGTREYSIPTNIGPDTFGIYRVNWSGTSLIPLNESIYFDYASIPTGTPDGYYIRGNTIGFNQTPTGSPSVMAFTHFKPPFYAFSVTDAGTGGATASAIVVSGGNIYVTRTTASGASTTTLSGVTYTTISGLVNSGLNLVSGVTATKSAEILGTEATSLLAPLTSQSILNTTVYVVEEVRAPLEYSEYLSYGAMSLMMEEDGQPDKAQTWDAKWREGLLKIRKEYKRQRRGYGFDNFVDTSDAGNYQKLGDRGFIIFK